MSDSDQMTPDDLGLSPGDRVEVDGQPATVVRVNRVSVTVDLDGSHIRISDLASIVPASNASSVPAVAPVNGPVDEDTIPTRRVTRNDQPEELVKAAAAEFERLLVPPGTAGLYAKGELPVLKGVISGVAAIGADALSGRPVNPATARHIAAQMALLRSVQGAMARRALAAAKDGLVGAGMKALGALLKP